MNEPAPVLLSVVVPVYNEELNLDFLFERLTKVLDGLKVSYEIVCVDDGSPDGTLAGLMAHHRKNPAIKVVGLSRNFGKEIALTAGLDHAAGAAVVPIDADLQDPPELIAEMIAKWREGFDVVFATRRTREGESWIKKATAAMFYRLISRISRVPIPPNTGDYRLMDRKVVDAVKRLTERTRFMKGLFSWVGFKQTSVLFDRKPRHKGTTSFNYWKLWNFALTGIFSFSTVPLQVWSYSGLLISGLALLYAQYLVLRTIILGVVLPGYASLIVTVLFLGGVQLITLGVLGEYLGRIYDEVKQRPLYLVRETAGFDARTSAPALVAAPAASAPADSPPVPTP